MNRRHAPASLPSSFALCFGLALGACSLACQSNLKDHSAEIEAVADAAGDVELNELVEALSGHFTSRAQSERDEEFFAIQMILTPIWQDREDGHWLYVEQATEARPEAPYRQRIYQVMRSEQVFVSHVYELGGNPKDWIGAHADPSRFDALQPKDLVLREGCSVFLTRTAPGTFVGGTRGQGCLSDWGEASYATSEVHVHPGGITSWDRGYQSDGEQAWGAVSGPYEFERK